MDLAERIADLLVRQLYGQLSEQEAIELNDWIGACSKNKQFVQENLNTEVIISHVEILGVTSTNKSKALDAIWERIERDKKQL